ncbi:hypothetical protein ABFV99_14215 [Cytobacillus horneckiae]|uniref:hypothetical protein n=1 Tax=Cytobacillus horneckiae TaxID=549687 RepID=UPI0034CF2027
MAENVRMAREYGITPLILRLNGSHGEAEIIHEESNLPVLQFKTLEAMDESNNIQIHMFPTHMIIEGNYSNHTYYFLDYKRIDDLREAIKEDLYFGNGEVDVEVLNYVPLEGIASTEQYIPFENADDGFNYMSSEDDSDPEEKIQMQLDLLKENLIDDDGVESYFTGELSSFLIDTVLFTDIPYESAPEQLTSILGKFASSKTDEQTVFCSVVLGSDYFSEERYSEENEDLYEEQVENLLSKSPYLSEGVGNHLRHIEVVVGMQDSIDARRPNMQCASTYACMRYSQDDFYNSATNKQLFHINNLLGTELKQDEVAKLSSSGYICIVPSIKKGFVPLSSKNLYPQNSIHSKPHYLRSIHYDVRRVANYFDHYIGEPLPQSLLQNILSQIDSFIDFLIVENPFYQDIKMEVVEFTQSILSLSISFELFGEIEAVRTSLDYVPSSEVNISWQ